MLNYSRASLAMFIITGATAILAWSPAWFPFGKFNAAEFQNVESIEARVASIRTGRNGVRLKCLVTNSGSRKAETIILTTRLRDQRGNVIAVNPFGSVSDLAPNGRREVEILLPSHAAFGPCLAEVESTLVRWAN